ncbi:uncharacterized protein C12orf50-like [Columba livia]|uniref:uncharacterized protein C12orf50-like n=1 Tax=Columba livia TaxID=8932 RepID=UPI0031BB0A52
MLKMSAKGNASHFHCTPCTQQKKYSHVACFWEKQPSGCVRINCAFHHSKPRNINGLFLPPSTKIVFLKIWIEKNVCKLKMGNPVFSIAKFTKDVPLLQGSQERTVHPAHHQESLRNQENIFLPVHAPLIISLKKEEEDEEDDEDIENYVSNWVPKTAAEIEEERAIKEICYKTGEYYRIQSPQEHQSAQTVSSPQEKEKLHSETTKRDLQKGDGSRIPRTFINTKREGEISGRRIPAERIPRRDRRSFDNGGKYTSASAARAQKLSPCALESVSIGFPCRCYTLTLEKGFHTSDPKRKQTYQSRGQRKDDETASYVPRGRAAGRKTYCDSSEPQRSTYVFYRTVNVKQEPKFNGSTDKYTSGSYNAPTWRKGNPRAKMLPKFETTVEVTDKTFLPLILFHKSNRPLPT